MDLISIIVPLYNMEDSIEKCVSSILSQSYKNLELILVDDGSTDGSLAKCKKIQSEDNRVKVIHTTNNGAGPARNTGIDNATGNYLYFPDADDLLCENAIKTMVSEIQNTQCDLLVFGYKELFQDGSYKQKKVFPSQEIDANSARISYANHVRATCELAIQGAPWNKLFSSSIVKQNSIQFPALRRHQDEVFISRYMCVCKKIKFSSEILYTHYVNSLDLQWKKYPLNYLDIVMELFKTRHTTILTWNKEDEKTHNLVQSEYICNVIKSIELSFSPKYEFGVKERKKWIESSIEKSKIIDFYNNKEIGNYQRFILMLIRKRNMSMLYVALLIKVRLENTHIYGTLKKRKR